MPTLSDNKQQFVINADSVFLNNNNDKHNSHILIQTKGAVNENDIEFSTCNVKVVDGDFSTKRIKDLAGNAVIDINTNAIDFKNSAISNLNLGTGTVTASTVASSNGYASLDLELDAHLALINGKVSQNGHTANKIFVSSNGGAFTTSGNCAPSDLAKLATNGAVDLNTAKTGITPSQASAIVANTAKVGITPTQTSDITANNAKTGITSSQASAIVANTAKTGITPSQASAIVANTAKVGITPTQASDITANNAKTGITSSQASAIVANTAKTGITSSQASAIVANTNKTGITSSQASAIVANTNKTGITSSQASAIVANTAKTGISSSQASAITANTAKTGITSSQASAITANTAKTGISSSQASAITANTAKTGISSGQANAIIANTAKTGITSSQATAITDNTQSISNISSSLNSVNSDIADIETKTNKITVLNSVSLGVETHKNVTLFAGPVGATSYVSNKNGNLTLKGGYDGNYDSGEISLYTNNTERMNISKDGHTTINISPGFQFDVKRASLSGYNGMRLLNSNGNYRNIIFINGSDAGYFQAYDNNNSSKLLLQAVGNSYFMGGRLGIGTTTPSQKLHVVGAIFVSGTGFSRSYSRYASSYTIAADDQAWHIYSSSTECGIDSEEYIASEGYLIRSDRRIKKDIRVVPDNLSLDTLRKIEVKYYKYKDTAKGNQDVIGFIAQEVKEHLPSAVQVSKKIIPDVMKVLNVSWNDKKMTSNDLQDVSGVKYRFYVSDISGNEKVVELVGDENNCFTFEEKWDNVFCYGKEVNDFHQLDKNRLWAINFSATQELDRKVTHLEQENQLLKTRLDALEERLEKRG